ncbi:MAG: hypothetical protein JNK40_09720 [Chromatiales bacterium]|nr:hypothetical protein [Chromatiales bacterium]
MHVDRFEIAGRFCGPPRSGNGGYVCGRVASRLPGPVAVRLKAPPPLHTELRLESTGSAARLFDGTTLVAEARCAPLDLQPPRAPSRAEAERAAQDYAGFHAHAFPGCFVCGPARQPGDGLRIFPGTVHAAGAGVGLLAAPWTPDASLAGDGGTVRPEFLWSALDCPGGFAVLPPVGGVAVVLGELWASIEGAVGAGEPCLVTAWPLAVDGRKHVAGSAVYGADGRLVARARAVWLEVPASSWT